MRKIQTQDVFKFARIVKRTNAKAEIAKIFEKKPDKEDKEDKDDISEKVGIQIILTLLEVCSDEETEEKIYDLIGGIAERSTEEMRSQSLEVTIGQIKQIFTENNMKAFFDAAGKLP